MEYPNSSLLDAIKSKTDCEPEMKTKLLEHLSKWKEKKGFELTKYNKEYVRILLELFLLENRLVSGQVVKILTDCLNYESLPSGPPQELLGEQRYSIMDKF